MPPALGLPVAVAGERLKRGAKTPDRADEIRPALKVCVTVGLTDEETAGAAEAVRSAVVKVLSDGSGY